ncbi:transcription factor [Sarracenia purpurea var. burkii]
MEDVFGSATDTRRPASHAEEDEEALRWAALEKLPTYARLRTSIIQSFMENGDSHENKKVVHKEVDVRKLEDDDRQRFIDTFFKVAEEDNEKFLKKFRNRIEK